MKGSKGSTTPGYSTTKAAKSNMKANTKMLKNTKIQDAKFGARQGYGLDKNLRMGKGFSKTARIASRVGQLAKGAVRVASKVAGPIGLGLMAYDAYKSGQKHSGGKAVKGQKSFMADAKKNTKSIYKKK